MNALSQEQAGRRERTLLAALLLSAWAPLATGLGVVLSRSTTQVADFVRRTVELAALFTAWWVFRRLERRGQCDPEKRATLERTANLAVAAALCCSGLVMIGLALSRVSGFQPGGNVYPGLIVGGLGLITNSWFWRRYSALAREQYSSIIDGQSRLYRAKTFADLCVVVALAAVAVDPSRVTTRYLDILGSVAIAAYLLWSGISAGLAHGQQRAAGQPLSGR
ncbi:MAG: cation transporter [bacterium]|nr:cation transporter [bacterium]